MKDTDVLVPILTAWALQDDSPQLCSRQESEGVFSKRKQQQQRSLGLHSEALTDDSYKCRLFYTGIASQSRVLTDEP